MRHIKTDQMFECPDDVIMMMMMMSSLTWVTAEQVAEATVGH